MNLARDTKAYKERPSPPYPAADAPTGAVRRGNDGRMWRAVETGRQKRWVHDGRSTAKANAFDVLPDDLIREIGKRMSPRELLRFASTNRKRKAVLAETVRDNPDLRVHALANKAYAAFRETGPFHMKMGRFTFGVATRSMVFRWKMFVPVHGKVLGDAFRYENPRLPKFDPGAIAIAKRVVDDPAAVPVVNDSRYIAGSTIHPVLVVAYVFVMGVMRGLPLRVSQRRVADRLREVFRGIQGVDISYDKEVRSQPA
jgi:hypothetical protein